MYKDLYYKMMTFKNRVWMENDFRGPIFLIFHFQISLPIWDMWWVKFFFKKTNSPIWSLKPSQNSSVGKGVDSHTKGTLPGWVPAPHWASFQADKKLWRLTPQVKYRKYNGQYEPQRQARVAQSVRAFASHTKGSLPGWVPVLLWASFQLDKVKFWVKNT